MGKGFKAGLLALTALAGIAPAFAQENGGRDRGGVERQGGGYGGGGQRPERPQGNWQGGQRDWNGNGGQQQPRVQAPGGGAARPVDRPANGQPGSGWQGRPAQPVANAPAAPVPNRGNPSNPGNPAYRGNPGGNGQPGNWQAGNRYGRPDGGGPVRAPDPGYMNRTDPNRWNGTAGQANRGYRPDDGRPRAGNGWQNNGWQNQGNWQNQGGYQNRGRLNANDRWRDQQRWSNNWRRDSRYDWSGYRQANRYAYRLPAYRPPSGWGYGYSRFSTGLFVGGPLYSNSYWIDDPYSYRLPPAYGTLRWIRYYNDALLVDIRDGYVVDVIHDFFW